MTERPRLAYRTPADLPSIKEQARDALLRLPADASEAALLAAVLDYAGARGWRCFHPKPAGYTRGVPHTAYDGDAGYPDVTLARAGIVLFLELKAAGKYPGPEQRAWREAIGASARVVRPKDAEEIVRLLE